MKLVLLFSSDDVTNVVLSGAIRGANKRTTGSIQESHRVSNLLPIGEFVWMHVFPHLAGDKA